MLRFLTASFAATFLATTSYAACSGPGAEALFSTEEIATMKAAAATSPFSDDIFWRAEKDGREIHVAGTVHIHDARLADVMARFEPVLTETDLLLLELNQSQQSELEVEMMANPQLLLLPEGQTMPDVLEPETWADVSVALESLGISPIDALPLQPWFLSLNLALPPCAVASLQSGEVGLDTMLELALPEGTPTGSLESWQDSLTFFTEPDYEQ